jgi:hypothetical protein
VAAAVARGSTGSGGLTAGSGGGIILDPSTGGTWSGYGGAFPTDCPTTQLSCSRQSAFTCSSQDYDFFVLPGDCECDFDHPASESDCEAGESFVCLGAAEDASGKKLDPPIPYNCSCIAGLEGTSCSVHCGARFEPPGSGACWGPGQISEDLQAFICGCAMTLLK